MKTPNYFCTWSVQNYLYGWDLDSMDPAILEGDSGARLARSYMGSDMLYGKHNLMGSMYPEARKDLYFLLDDGWDVPQDVDWDMFGSLAPHPDRFPDCPADPTESLRMLNERAKAAGWAGLGLWIAAQEAPAILKNATPEQQEAYWRERLEWSENAGIHYWKVDWGILCQDRPFRIRMTEWGRKYAPNLVIEHAVNQGCVNDENNDHDSPKLTINTGRVDPELIRKQCELLDHVDILRSYDVFGLLSISQTIERVSALLDAMQGHKPTGMALINCEDECLVGASLGLTLGVMRHPLRGKRPSGDVDVAFPPNDRNFKQRIDEVTRSVRWQQIMPAYGVCEEPVFLSSEILTDSWVFQPGETWLAKALGQLVPQSAPAKVSRGMPLPIVSAEGELPFVTASCHENCAAVAAHGRTQPGRSWFEPLADVSIELNPAVNQIGVFGRYASLTVKGLDLTGKRILARDLMGGDWVELTAQDSMIHLTGAQIDEIGLANATPNDQSSPGLQISIQA